MATLRNLACAILGFSLGVSHVFAQGAALTGTHDGSDIVVQVKKHGATIVVDVEMAVHTSPMTAWDVLTDYDRMAQFVGNIQSSRITDRKGNTLVVSQKSGTSFGMLKFAFDNVREVELVPYSEIRSKLISGDMKASAFTTRIVTDGAGTRIFNHGEFIPTMWVPPLIGVAFLETETRRQFHELRNEMMRRAAKAGPAAPAAS